MSYVIRREAPTIHFILIIAIADVVSLNLANLP